MGGVKAETVVLLSEHRALDEEGRSFQDVFADANLEVSRERERENKKREGTKSTRLLLLLLCFQMSLAVERESAFDLSSLRLSLQPSLVVRNFLILFSLLKRMDSLL